MNAPAPPSYRKITVSQLTPRFFNTPLALDPLQAAAIVNFLTSGGSEKLLERPSGLDDDCVAQGVAIINVTGILLHRIRFDQRVFGMTGYQDIRSNFDKWLSDRAVRGIVLHLASPGGEVGDCLDLADKIYHARGRKPIWAILSKSALSGAYAIASAADRITVPGGGSVGGIGIVAVAADRSNTRDGARAGGELSVTTRDVRQEMRQAPTAHLQADIDRICERFVASVARNRGISAATVAAMGGTGFLGDEGVRLRLADTVLAPSEAFGRFLDLLNEGCGKA